jgi:hypothetical protein
MATQQAHFVPRTYLKEFAFDTKKRKVYAYNEKTGDVRPTSIDTICSQRYLYRVEDEAGLPSDEIEDFFATDVEPQYKMWIDLIRKQKTLSNSVIADLAHYVAIQHVRVPTTLEDNEEMGKAIFREVVNEQWAKLLDDDERKRVLTEMKKQHPEQFAEFKKNHPDASEELSKEDIQNIIDGNGFEFEIDIGRNSIVKLMLDSIPEIAKQIVASGWNFVSAPSGTEFITSDMPCYVMIPMPEGAISFRHGGFGHPGAHIVMPLAKDLCLIIQQGGYYQRFGTAKHKSIDEINQLTAQHSKQYIIGANESIVQSHVKFYRRDV